MLGQRSGGYESALLPYGEVLSARIREPRLPRNPEERQRRRALLARPLPLPFLPEPDPDLEPDAEARDRCY